MGWNLTPANMILVLLTTMLYHSAGQQGNQTSQYERKSVLNIHWKDWLWSWSSNTLATSCQESTHWKRPWCWETLKAGGEGMTEDEMLGWHHWLNGHECEQTPGVGDGQGSLACCSPWGCRIRHNLATEQQQYSIPCRIYICVYTHIYMKAGLCWWK